MSEIISLNKGEKINLSKGDFINLSKMPAIDLAKGGHGLSRVVVGLGWDPAKRMVEKKGLFGFKRIVEMDAPDIDCDAFAIKLYNGKVKSQDDLIYYGHRGSSHDSVYHTGDNLTGDGDGDDEQIIIDLSRVDCDSILLAVCIYQGRSRKQHFGMIENAFIRIVDETTNEELCKFNLDDSYDNYVTVTFGELVKNNNEWTFKAIGSASNKETIGKYAHEYGY